MFPNVPALVVTATASTEVREQIATKLDLREPVMITAHPDRHNIKYKKQERRPSHDKQDDLDEILLQIACGLQNMKQDYPLTILYAELEDIGYAYRYLETALQMNQYVGESIPENRLFGMYHQAYSKRMKDHIVTELGSERPRVRFVTATVALGMGLDAPSVRKVIHFKSPTSIEKYLQETGRAGRDGMPAEALLYYNNSDLRSNRPGQQSAMVNYCRATDQCLRLLLMRYLGFNVPERRLLCQCCQFCEESCHCESCSATLISLV